MADDPDDDVPPGWDYNPTTWGQRLPLVGLALLGMCVAGYLALYQYGITSSAWDPFFGAAGSKNGTETILTSDLSFPLKFISPKLHISDATLGAFSYLLDAIAGAVGGTRRWKTMPWIVIVFAVLVGPLGLVSLLLTMAQPLLYGHWCTLCLCSAVISLLMIGPAMDEALASLQYMKRVKDAPEGSHAGFWKIFWGLGGVK